MGIKLSLSELKEFEKNSKKIKLHFGVKE